MNLAGRINKLESAVAETPVNEPETPLTLEQLRKLSPEELERRHRRALGLDGPAGAVCPRPDPAHEARLRQLSDAELDRLHRVALGYQAKDAPADGDVHQGADAPRPPEPPPEATAPPPPAPPVATAPPPPPAAEPPPQRRPAHHGYLAAGPGYDPGEGRT